MKRHSGEGSLPEAFEEYRIIRLLGQGGMGQVYLAEDRLLNRLVAIKFIAAESPSADARERFFVEARAVARLSHPNVVAVHRVGEVQRRPFLVSEYVRGPSLDALARPVPSRRALEIAIDLARGVAAAHRRGVLHRDIKLANAVVSEEGTVKVLDFGLAELLPENDPTPAESPGPGAEGAVGPPRGADAGPGGVVSTEDESAFPPPPRVHGAAMESTTDAPLAHALASTDAAPPGSEARPASRAATGPATRRRRVVGTARYMAPETWRGEPATPRADVYALGIVIYELCAGSSPYENPEMNALIWAKLESDAPPLAHAAPGVDPRLAAVVDRCLARDPARRFADGDALREALEQIAAAEADPASLPEGNPYRGLLAFEAAHRRLFFGRGAEVLAVLDRLRAEPFLLVAGDSGTGKSSLCRAGVLPAVADGALGRRVATATVTPGRHPLDSLAAALLPLLGGDGATDEVALAARIRAEPGAVARALRRRHGEVLLFVDQLEELCTYAPPGEAAATAEALAALADDPGGLRILAAARSDFLTRLSALPGLSDAISRALYLLRPLTAERLREAVTGPAAAKGVSFESEAVVEALVKAALHAEGGLPLLQFALEELWEARDETRRVIPGSALDAIGGVSGALARHADGVLARLAPPQRAAAQAMLLALVTAEGTRAWRVEAELLSAAAASPAALAALSALVRGRLLVAREAEGGAGSVYGIAHEALLTGWDTLRGWIGRDIEGRALRQKLERAAAEWERAGRATEVLWGERLLAAASRIEEASLAAREASFLAMSRRAARRRRLGRWTAALAVLAAIGLTSACMRLTAHRDLTRRVDDARLALEQARAARAELDRLRRDAFARFDAGQSELAEPAWEQARRRGATVERAYAEVSGHLELIVLQDGYRQDAREMFVDALCERAALADQDGRVAERDELVRQLRLHERRSDGCWEAPARLSIETSPPGAEVSMERVELDAAPREAERLGATPIVARRIASGSVIFTLSAPGRARVRLPLVLGLGEEQRVVLDLPAEAAVPRGYVYVPPGRFLYGSVGEARSYYLSQPLHPVETGAYLIAQNETTFAEWIEFLRALTPEKRRELLPGASASGMTVALKELADGDYQLTFGPEATPVVARTGEPIRYRGRDRRVAQDWLRIPVLGVSFDDALAYSAWLDRSGRVPGARVCDEREWERAARGADGRVFPWGEHLDADLTNHEPTYGRDLLGFGPDEVGTRPASRSPLGVHDLAGNVWEWASAAEGAGVPVVRGGSFFSPSSDVRAENRSPDVRARRDVFAGVRICATPQ
ncbi:nSTAND1 domain-containing NTPase [Sorangium sp. So ce1153]|uniref:nSTAND1 domain-containing NTPase n=1 Tax=Sorangium sp. So ce1153 TaxID=3133333 RepID=UPI003F624663